MLLVRGRPAAHAADRALVADLFDHSREKGEAVVRVWQPHRQVAFGRRDANEAGYDDARRIARERGFEPVERSVGGRAVAYTGTTVAFARYQPTNDPRHGLTDRYEATTDELIAAFRSLGVSLRRGEPAASFCPGTHSLQADGKVLGIAQRIRDEVALVAGVVIVRDRDAVADVLDPVYDALDVPFDPDSVGSVSEAGGPSDPAIVRRTLEAAFTDGHGAEVRDAEAIHSSD